MGGPDASLGEQDRDQHGKGQHRQGDVAVPAGPAAAAGGRAITAGATVRRPSRGAGLVVVEAELVLGGLEAALDRSAVPFDLDQDPGPGRAPGREEAKLAVGDGVADQEAPHPQAKEAVAILGSLEVGQLKMG